MIFVFMLLCMVHVFALENIALNKPTWQEHPWPDQSVDYGSENAVDGLYTDRRYTGGQCTINEAGYYTAELRVDLGNVLNISHINIFYRTFNQNPGPFVDRMAGFSLYISNITSKDSGHLCYKDDSRGSPSVSQTIPCPIYGRYVIYYNERSPSNNPSYLSQYAYNELCEIEVYGYRGSYGNCCQNPCPHHCMSGECDAYTGHCRECKIEYYGQNCSNRCSTTCNVTERCDKITGRCDGGCKPGWTGNTCDQKIECPPGQYGNDCSNQCSLNCNVTRTCDKFTGQCEGGCKPGFTGNTCDQLCESGYFGQECRQQCNINCNVTTQCNKVSGQCEGGCKPGWKGSSCDQMCESGYYGKNCSNQCSTNCDMASSCDKVTGECDRGCNAGWAGIHCDQECLIPYFGKNCSDKCSTTCNATGRCDKVTGRCDGGCKPGWTGNTCDQRIVCNNGYYGPECRSKCGHCLESKHCHYINGSCLNGCLHGYRGDLCNETCPSGFFGLDCTNRCDIYCTGNESCDPVMGICNEGCKKGWSGLICGLDSFSSRQPYGDNKPIVIGIVLAVGIVLIGSAINFIYWRRKTGTSMLNAHTRHNNYDPKTDYEEKPENTTQQYTELGEVNKLSNYDELNNYSVFSVE